MTDDVVERAGKAIYADQIEEQFSLRAAKGFATAAFATLRPGDELPGGMRAAPEVLTPAMREVFWKNVDMRLLGGDGNYALNRLWSAMLTAAKEGKE